MPRQQRDAFQRHLAALLERLDCEAPFAALDHPIPGRSSLPVAFRLDPPRRHGADTKI